MKKLGRIALCLLGVAHVVTALVLLPATLFFGYYSMIVLVPALIWLVILGVRLCRPGGRLRRQLLITHIVLAPLAGLLVAYGAWALRAARQSAEGGGGLLGAVGVIPIGMGLVAGLLSLITLVTTFTTTYAETTKKRDNSPR